MIYYKKLNGSYQRKSENFITPQFKLNISPLSDFFLIQLNNISHNNSIKNVNKKSPNISTKFFVEKTGFKIKFSIQPKSPIIV